MALQKVTQIQPGMARSLSEGITKPVFILSGEGECPQINQCHS